VAKQIKQYQHTYPSDLTDAQWAIIEPLLGLDPDEPARTYHVRDIIDALFYFARSGCAWRYLPGDFPPWQNVQYYFYKWTRDNTWESLNTNLRKRVRFASGRQVEPTAGSIDAQSVKTTEKRGPKEITVMTLGRRLKAVNDTYSLIHSVSS
jgi:putative transposase